MQCQTQRHNPKYDTPEKQITWVKVKFQESFPCINLFSLNKKSFSFLSFEINGRLDNTKLKQLIKL